MSENGGMPDEFPFIQPGGSDLDMFIQWKGSIVCMDLTCASCGLEAALHERASGP